MAAAFFGGAIAVFIVGIANLIRLNSSIVHYGYLLGSFVIIVGLSAWAMQALEIENRNLSVVMRISGFALMGLLYFLHRRAYRSMQVMGVDHPSPYVLVICACIVGIVAGFIGAIAIRVLTAQQL